MDKSGINLGLINSSCRKRRDPLPLQRQQKDGFGTFGGIQEVICYNGIKKKKKKKLLLEESLKVKLVWLCDLFKSAVKLITLIVYLFSLEMLSKLLFPQLKLPNS